MTIEARIRELGNRHRSLDETIQQEMRRPTADPTHLRVEWHDEFFDNRWMEFSP